MPKNQLSQQFMADFDRLEREYRPGFTLELSLIEAWALFGAVQLVCRHPGFTGPVKRVVEGVARRLQGKISVTPAMKEMAKRGWQAEYDA